MCLAKGQGQSQSDEVTKGQGQSQCDGFTKRSRPIVEAKDPTGSAGYEFEALTNC